MNLDNMNMKPIATMKGWWWKKYFKKYRVLSFLLQKSIDKWWEENNQYFL